MRNSELEKIVRAVSIVLIQRAGRDPFSLDYHANKCSRKRPAEYTDTDVMCIACEYEYHAKELIEEETGDASYFGTAIAVLNWHELVTELFVPLLSFDEETQALIIAVHKEKKRLREQAEFNQHQTITKTERQNRMEVSYDRDGHTACIKLSDFQGTGKNAPAVRRAIRRTSGKIV